jgi:hypothetical protein
MKRVSQDTFMYKTTKDFTWEAMTDVNKFGMVEVRCTKTSRKFTVMVEPSQRMCEVQ